MNCCPEAQLKGGFSLWQRMNCVSPCVTHFHLSRPCPKTLGKLVVHIRQTTASKEMNELFGGITDADIKSGASDVMFLSFSKRLSPQRRGSSFILASRGLQGRARGLCSYD